MVNHFAIFVSSVRESTSTRLSDELRQVLIEGKRDVFAVSDHLGVNSIKFFLILNLFIPVWQRRPYFEVVIKESRVVLFALEETF